MLAMLGCLGNPSKSQLQGRFSSNVQTIVSKTSLDFLVTSNLQLLACNSCRRKGFSEKLKQDIGCNLAKRKEILGENVTRIVRQRCVLRSFYVEVYGETIRP